MTGARTLADGPVVAIYDTGVGGLTALQECLMAAPDATFLFFADKDMLPHAEAGTAQLCARLSEVARFLRERGVEVVVPAAVWVWPYLDGFRREGLAVIDPWMALEPAVPAHDEMLGVVAPRPLVESGALERWGSARFVVSDSSGLAASVERKIVRDQRLIDAVERSATDLRPAGAGKILLLDSHASLVVDVFKRKLPRAEFIAPQHAFARLLSEVLETKPGPNPDPQIDFVVSGAYGEDLRAWASHVLAIPSPQVDQVMRSSDDDLPAPSDVVSLAYAAFDNGGGELRHYVEAEAILRATGRSLLKGAMSCRRSLERCETTIEEMLITGQLVGVVGTRRVSQNGRDSSVPFAHMIEVVDDKIHSLSEEPTGP